jgi:hypothetical protein
MPPTDGYARAARPQRTRTATTDETARRKFTRYWWLVRPFAAYVMRAALATIAANAARSPAERPIAV